METTIVENRTAGKAKRGVTISGALLFYYVFCLIFLYRFDDSFQVTRFDNYINFITRDVASVISLTYLVIYYKKSLSFLKRNLPIVLFSIFAFISCFWSINLAFSMMKCLKVTQGLLILITFILLCKDVGLTLRLIVYPMAILLVASLIAGAFFPAIGRHDYTGVFIGDGDLSGTWKGVFNHKNSAGLVIIILGIISIGYAMRKSKVSAFIFYLCIFALSCTFLFFAQDKTVYFAFGVSLVVFLIDYLSRFIFRVSLYASKVFCLTLTAIIMAILFFFNYVGLVYIYPTYGINFTDRVRIWQVNLDYWRDHSWLGHGFYGVYMENDGIRKFSDTMGAQLVSQAHSSALSILGEMGFAGCFFLFILMSTTFYRSLRMLAKLRRVETAILAMCFTVVLTTSLTEAIYVRDYGPWYISCTILLLINIFPLPQKSVEKALNKRTIGTLRKEAA